ncbi:MAG TPA: electron transport complex subunit RsxC [bacterium]|nr:electron transport complex subunit RsxC [bacterium]HPP29427.1 electron transport complex subunit RsxC [bacterium]
MFQGGVKLVDFKEISKGKVIENFPASEKVIIPLSQHTGIPSKPLVKKGDAVLKGQLIGENAGFISSATHSSVSGTVIGIENCPLPGGRTTPAVVIENDGKDIPVEPVNRDWKNLKSEEIISIVRDSGIVGMGGAAFPSAVKLTIPKGKKAEYVLLNGCECEPFLTADYRVMREEPDRVVEGLLIICRALEVKKAYIGIESNKRDLVPLLRETITKFVSDTTVEIKVVPERYPQGSEKHLIKSVLNREVPSGGLPVDVGCVVFNVQTALAIRDAVCEGKPLIERVLTVTGLVRSPKNLRVRIGTPVSKVIEYCGIEITEKIKVILGGPMMGIQINNLDIPVLKGTSGILILPEEILPEEIQPCIRCGKCIEACPMLLVPAELGRYAENKRWDRCAEFNVADCIECGCCTYICPAKRPLVDLFKWAKAEIRKAQK